jgi:hypothetical protein
MRNYFRPSVETLAAAMRKLGNTDDEDDHGEESLRSTRAGVKFINILQVAFPYESVILLLCNNSLAL